MQVIHCAGAAPARPKCSAFFWLLTLGAHTQRGLSRCFVIPSVRPSVCLFLRFLSLRATRRPITDTNGFSATLALFSVFWKNAAFQTHGVKQSEGANMQIRTGLPRPALRTLDTGGTRSCNAGRALTPACYLVV